MTDTCSTCGGVRPKRAQWFYAISTKTGETTTWCPTCAPADLVAKRKESRLRFLRRRP